MTESAHPVPTPRDLVADLDRLRSGVRERSRVWWFPLALFGGLVLLSLPFHIGRTGVPQDDVGYGWPVAILANMGGIDSPSPVLTGAYWLVALTVGYVGTGLYYRRHALSTGLRRPVRWFVTLGLVLTLLVFPLRLFFLLLPLTRTTSAVVVILLTVLVLAVRERDARLWTITAVLAVVTVVVNSYNVENVLFRLGLDYSPSWASLPNVALPGLVLLAGGLLGRPRSSRVSGAPSAAVPA
jgi:hypothetical protein